MLPLLLHELLLLLLLECQLPDKVLLVWYVHIVHSAPGRARNVSLGIKRHCSSPKLCCGVAERRRLHDVDPSRCGMGPLEPDDRIEQCASAARVHPIALVEEVLHGALAVKLCVQVFRRPGAGHAVAQSRSLQAHPNSCPTVLNVYAVPIVQVDCPSAPAQAVSKPQHTLHGRLRLHLRK